VWRILDCKNEPCQAPITAAPPTAELLGAESREYFRRVCAGLDAARLPYELDPRLVRGLDYYVHTVFEVVFAGIGAQNAIAGGGRYEIRFGKQPLAGVGFAAGIERLLLAREELGLHAPPLPRPHAYLVSLGDLALQYNLVLADRLRRAGHPIQLDLENRGMKAQLRSADKCQAMLALIVGDNELAKQVLMAKDLTTGDQQEWPLAEVAARLAARCPMPTA